MWHHLANDDFDRIVVNVGRNVGTSLETVVQYLQKDSTYGRLHHYLHGQAATADLKVVDEERGILSGYGREIRILREARNPRDIPWADEGVEVVVDCTGRFVNPSADGNDPRGSLRGHLDAGARAVLQSSAFKLPKGEGMPSDSIMLIEGINDYLFDPAQHKLISAASCTTTALAHMMRPLLDNDLTQNMLTAGMSTVHAATNTQVVLDSVPGAGAKDLRKSRGALGNVCITSTNAASALELVMPEIGAIGFMADSVRIPIATGSLIILNVTFQSEAQKDGSFSIDRNSVNEIYRAAQQSTHGLVLCSDEQNVSTDVIGENAAVVIEATETHSRTGFMTLRLPDEAAKGASVQAVRVPLTHVKVCGWYDNELGSYTNRLGQLTSRVAKSL